MTEISDRYRRNAEAFAATVAGVPADGWGAPSPCEGWDAREVVRHVVGAHGIFEGLVGRELGPAPSVDDDPAGALAAAVAQVGAELDDPALAGVEFDGFAGRASFAAAVDRFLSTDLVVHRWDLARATGQDETIPTDEVARLWATIDGFDEASMRGPQAFGPAVEPPEGADDQTRILCFLGRRP
jgi:uncharacterized protein (TIGR03086 family)